MADILQFLPVKDRNLILSSKESTFIQQRHCLTQYAHKILSLQLTVQGRSQDFSKGRHTVSNIIVMAFSPRNIVGCLLKKGLQRGVTGTPGPPRRYALAVANC